MAVGEDGQEVGAVHTPHYSHMRQGERWAVCNEQRGEATNEANGGY